MIELIMAISLWCDNGGVMQKTINERKLCKTKILACVEKRREELVEKDWLESLGETLRICTVVVKE